jgi:hypothetical protein
MREMLAAVRRKLEEYVMHRQLRVVLWRRTRGWTAWAHGLGVSRAPELLPKTLQRVESRVLHCRGLQPERPGRAFSVPMGRPRLCHWLVRSSCAEGARHCRLSRRAIPPC